MDYLKSQEQIVKGVMKSGNAGSVYVSKEWIGQRVVVRPLSIKENILQIIAPYLETIVGVYLYGSYARGEDVPESDVDVLVIADESIPLKDHGGIDIGVVKIDEIRDKIRLDPVGYYSIIREAVPIMNRLLLAELREVELDPRGITRYYEATESALSIVEGLLGMAGDLSGSIYSLILRLRGMYLIQCNLEDKRYSNQRLEDFIVKKGLERSRYRRMYAIYRAVRDGRKVPACEIPVKDVRLLHNLAERLLKEKTELRRGRKERQKA